MGINTVSKQNTSRLPILSKISTSQEDSEQVFSHRIQKPSTDIPNNLANNVRLRKPSAIPIRSKPSAELKNASENVVRPSNQESQLHPTEISTLLMTNSGSHVSSFRNQNVMDREFTHRDGEFPLKANTSELVWQCVQLEKIVEKSFVIQNKSEKMLRLKIEINGPGFQLLSGADTNELLALQANEYRMISIAFCPTNIGKAIGKVIFRPAIIWPHAIERTIHLMAYGGSTVIQLQGIELAPNECAYLKMGETSNIKSSVLKRTFKIYNRGPLNGVASICIRPNSVHSFNENHIVIEPSKCAIQPNSSTDISVSYEVQRSDLKKLEKKSCKVLTVGALEVITGFEPNRQRIASMLTRNNTIPTKYKHLSFLVNDFPVASSEQFNDYREHINNVNALFDHFKTTGILLTINRTDLDETIDSDVVAADESTLFLTAIDDSGNIQNHN